MSFNTISFVLFLMILLAAYAFVPNRHKWKLLLAASLIFYGWSGLDKLAILLLTSLVVWLAGRKMDSVYQEYEKARGEGSLSEKEKTQFLKGCKTRCRRFLTAALAVCVGILCYCKFAGMLLGSLSGLLRMEQGLTAAVIVPLGISYYTFSSAGYLLDIYWRKTRAESSYFRLLLCMIYFPHILEGPISRYQKLLPQFDRLTRPDYSRLCFGLQLMLWGYFKKMVVADRLLIFVNSVFSNIEKNAGFTFVIALAFSSFQLYADFSGCMDIVHGVSDILGIQLDKNFDHPFFSRSAAEFWRRWHITLGTWFKDYIYMPIAISPWMVRIGKAVRSRWGASAGRTVTTVIPLAAVWFLTGIWHGTGWNYVVWGMYYGILVICGTLFADKYRKMAQKLHIDTASPRWAGFQKVRTFCLHAIGRLLTVPGSVPATLLTVRRIFSSCNLWIFWDGSLYGHGLDRRNFLVAVLSILLLLWVDKRQEQGSLREAISRENIVLRWTIYYLGIFAVLILGIYGPGYDASSFVYANF